jgi:hypothetical protein
MPGHDGAGRCFDMTGIRSSPNFTYRPAKLLILLVVTQLCSHKLFQIYVDTTRVQ